MKISILFLLILCGPINLFSQNIYNRKYTSNITNANNLARANAVIQLRDSNYFIAGMNYNQSNIVALKLAVNGDTIWSYCSDLGINSGEYLMTICEASDGNYVVGGVSGDPILLNSHADLIKFDKNTGDTLWVRKIGLPNRSERFHSIKETTDHGFIASGLRYNVNNNGAITDSDIYLVKTDSMGIPEWERTYGGSNYDFANSIEIADDGGFMLFGTTYSYGQGAYNMYLVKTDSLGNQLWQKTYGGILEDYGLSMCKLQDGNYSLAGCSYFSVDSNAAYIAKINPYGNIIWEKSFKGIIKQQEFSGVKQLSTGEILVCGNRQGDDLNNTSFGILYKLDETDGSIIWQKQYDYFQEDSTQHYFYGMDVCLDGGVVMAGMVLDLRPGASPGNSMWVVKTDCMGNDSIWDNTACPLPDTIASPKPFNLYPNPTNGSVTVDYFIPENSTSNQLTFYDATGKKVETFTLSGEGQVQLSLDCSAFANGVYNGVLVSDGKVLYRRKLVMID